MQARLLMAECEHFIKISRALALNIVQVERNTKLKTKFLIFISETPPNLSKISYIFVL